MKIATFNVNSIKARLPRVLEWLEESKPDVALLQEIKTQTADFPELEFKALDYNVAAYGQKSYNGVAILSRHSIDDIKTGLPGDPEDDQARYIEATIKGVRVGGIYLPNGNPVDTDKFPYKLAWMDRLTAHVRDTLLPTEMPIVLGGKVRSIVVLRLIEWRVFLSNRLFTKNSAFQLSFAPPIMMLVTP